MSKKFFKSKFGQIQLPVFFPDATRAVLKSLDTTDIENTNTPGILVNTYHLYKDVGFERMEKYGSVRNFMNYKGGVISDSGGFQVMSVVKKGLGGKITDDGVVISSPGKRKKVFTPEESIRFQMLMGADMIVVLDDFTDPNDTRKKAEESVKRTIEWAKRSKSEFEKNCKEKQLSSVQRPYILGVVQGGEYQDLRKYCAEELVKIGFDGFGYGGWPIDKNGNFDYLSAKTITDNAPDDYLLYGLGVGKPEDIVGLSKIGFNIFDCVLPTRDGRHGRLYVYNFDSIEEIDLNVQNFYSFISPNKDKYLLDNSPISTACDCLLCTRYSKAYLAHLFKIGDFTAGRLATIHNLRFYSLLMEKIKENIFKSS